MSKIVANQLSPQSGDTITFNGSISVGGTVTYEDVTNVDSVGIITARSGVSIGDSIFHTGDTNTAIRFPAADTFTVETGGSEALRVDSSQRLLSGTTTEGAVNADDLTIATSGDTGITIRSADDGYGNLFFSDGTSGAAEYAGYVQYNHNNNSLVLGANSSTHLSIDSSGRLLVNNNAPFGTQDRSSFHSFLQVKGNSFSTNGDGAISLGTGVASGTDSVTGSIFFNDADGGDRAAVRGFSESAGGSGNYPGYLTFYTNEGTANPSERVRITASGAFVAKSGLAEKYENAGTTLGAQTNNPLKDGNVILFTGNESGNNTINFTGVHSTISNGETVSFTVIITPNNSGVINVVQIDGQAITVKWSGGSAPSAGSSGQDIYTFQILKTGTGTSDYTIFGAAANYA